MKPARLIFRNAASSAALAAGLALHATGAYSQTTDTSSITNVGLETGNLSGWNTGGGTGSQSAGAYSSVGKGATVVTGMTSFDSTSGASPGIHSWTVTPYGSYMASLQAGSSSASGLSFATGSTALGLSTANQNAIVTELNDGSATSAAWMYQDINLAAGQSFTMAWQYVSTDYSPFNDASITTLINLSSPTILADVNNSLSQYALLGATVAGTGNYATGSYGATGWETATYTVSDAGTYRLGFMSFNLSDTENSPILFVDQAPGTTSDKGVPFAPIGPNPGSTAPTTPTTPTSITSSTPQTTSTLSTSTTKFDGGTLTVDQSPATVNQDMSITSNGGTIDQDGQNSTFSGVFSNDSAGVPGSLSVVNSGTGGSVSLTGANTYTGSTTIGSGASLDLAGNGSIANSSGVVDNGVFNISGTTSGASVKTITGNGSVALGDKTLTLADASGTLGGAITGTGGVAIVGGAETLTGSNSYSGSTTIGSGATLDLAGNGSIAGSSGVVDNGTLDISGTTAGATLQSLSGNGAVALGCQTLTLNNASGTFGGAINGCGGVSVASGSETLTGTNGYTGETNVGAGGTLALAGTGSIATSSGVVDNGSLDISGTTTGASLTSLSGNGAVTLGSKDLTLAGASGTFDGTITGTGGVAVIGGAETLTGINGYTGGTTIGSGGTVALAGGGSVATSSSIIDNGTLDISATNAGASLKTLSGNGSVALGSKDLTFTDASDAFDGTIDGSGGVAVNSGAETLTGTNGYTGATSITPGATLALAGTGSIAGSSNLVDNGTFDISNTSSGATLQSLSGNGAVALGCQTLTLNNAAGSFGGSINGCGGVSVAGGQETLSGTNGYTGTTTIAPSATLALAGSGSIAGSSGLFDNGNLDISGTADGALVTTLSGNGGVTLGSQNLTLANASGTFDGAIDGTGGVAVAGGEEVLTGANEYTGATTIASGGTLALTGNGSIAGSGVADNGTFDISGTITGATIQTLTGNGAVALGCQTLTLASASGTFDGSINGCGGVTVAGGSEALTGNNGYTGQTIVASNATLALTGSGSIAASSGLLDNGTFDIANTSAGASVTKLNGDGAVVLGNQTLTLTDASGNFDGAINGSGGMTLSAGSETLTAVNSYTGQTALAHDATLVLAGTGSIAGSSVTDNGILDISGTNAGATIQTLSGNGAVALGCQTLTLANASETFGGSINGCGGVTVAGGHETLTGNNGYMGATIISPGATLAMAGAGSVAASSNVIDNGTFDIEGESAGAQIQTLSGNGAVMLGNQNLTLSDASGTFGGTIYGTGSVILNHGSETLTGVSGFTGQTIITPGATLALAGNGSISDSSVVDNGSVDISGTVQGASVQTLSGNGTVSLGAKGLTLTNGSDTFAGMISGAGGFALASGQETLSGTDTYTGQTAISSDATLTIDGAAALPSTSALHVDGTLIMLSSGAAGPIEGLGKIELSTGNFTSTSNADTVFAGEIAGAGGFTKSGSGLLALNGANSFTGGLDIAGGSVAAATDGNLGAGSVQIDHATLVATGNLASGKSFTLTDPLSAIDTNGHDAVLSGTISGSGTLNKLGTGTLTLTGTNSQNGIVVNGGTLAFNSDAALGKAGSLITIEQDTTLETLADFTLDHPIDVDNATTTFDTDGHNILMAGDILGAGVITKIGSGILTLTGDNSQVQINVIGGGVIANSQSAIGATDGDIYLQKDSSFIAGANLNVTQRLHVVGTNATFDTGANDVTLSGTSDGDACLIKTGTGRLNMTGAASNAIGACVEQGTLSFNNVFTGNVWVYNDGTAGGSGQIDGNVDVMGTLAPGNSPGRLVVAGSVTQEAGSALAIDVDGTTPGIGAGHYDTLVLTGASSIYTANGTLMPRVRGITGNATNTFVPTIGETFEIVTADGGVEGSFTGVLQPTNGMPANSRFDVRYLADSIILEVTPASYAGLFEAGTNGNAAAVGQVIDVLRGPAGILDTSATAPLVQGFAALTVPQVSMALEQASGEIYADAMDGVLQANRTARSAVSEHLNNGIWLDGTSLGQHIWGTYTSDVAHVSADHSGQGYALNSRTGIIGVDGRVAANTILGTAFAWSHVMTQAGYLGSAHTNGYHGMVYARWTDDNLYVNGIIAAGSDSYHIKRVVDLSSGENRLAASPQGFSVAGDVEVGLRIRRGIATLTPLVGLSYDNVDRQAFSEGSDNLVALRFHDDARNAWAVRAGARLGADKIIGGIEFKPYASIIASRELGSASASISPIFSGTELDVHAVAPGRTTVRATGGIVAQLSTRISVNAGYSYGSADGARDNRASGGLNIAW